jgi:hypothetical protein
MRVSWWGTATTLRHGVAKAPVANKSRLISPCARWLRGWLAPSRRGPRGRSPGAAAARAVLSRPDAQLGIRLRGSVPVALTVIGAVMLSKTGAE